MLQSITGCGTSVTGWSQRPRWWETRAVATRLSPAAFHMSLKASPRQGNGHRRRLRMSGATRRRYISDTQTAMSAVAAWAWVRASSTVRLRPVW